MGENGTKQWIVFIAGAALVLTNVAWATALIQVVSTVAK